MRRTPLDPVRLDMWNEICIPWSPSPWSPWDLPDLAPPTAPAPAGVQLGLVGRNFMILRVSGLSEKQMYDFCMQIVGDLSRGEDLFQIMQQFAKSYTVTRSSTLPAMAKQFHVADAGWWADDDWWAEQYWNDWDVPSPPPATPAALPPEPPEVATPPAPGVPGRLWKITSQMSLHRRCDDSHHRRIQRLFDESSENHKHETQILSIIHFRASFC